ncbi:Calcium-binding mitochondrial carrier protein SCaMC-1 [Linum perenne]
MAKKRIKRRNLEDDLCFVSETLIGFYVGSNMDISTLFCGRDVIEFVENSSTSYLLALRDGYELLKQLVIFSGIELDPLFTRFAIYTVESFFVVPFVENIVAPLSCITLLSQSQTVVSRQLEEVFREHRGWFSRGALYEWRILFRKVSGILEEHVGYNNKAVNWISTVHRLAYYGITLFVHLSFKNLFKVPLPKSNVKMNLELATSFALTTSLQANFVYGVLASLTATLITHPLDTLRTRIAVLKPGNYEGLWHSFMDICRDDGFKSLYAGLLPSLLGVVPSMAISVSVYKTLSLACGLQRSTPHRFMINLACSTIASLVASTATFPIQVVKRRMQIEGQEDSNNMNAVRETVERIVEDDGVGGLYKGIQPHCFNTIFSHVISFVAYEVVRVPCSIATISLCFAFDFDFYPYF